MINLDEDKLKTVVGRMRDLPPLPKVVSKMLAVVNDERSAAKDLAEVISKDPAFTAKVLRIVNSAFYGFSERISTVTHAVVILGYQTIKDMTLGLSVFEVLGKKSEEALLDKNKFWQHSLGCASAARLLAKYTSYPEPEEAFIAGLLHDIGKITFDLYLRKDFIKVMDLVDNEGLSMFDAEKKIYGISHAQMGEQVASKWNLPYTLRAVIRYHHAPIFGRGLNVFDQKIIAIVYFANIFCKLRGIGFRGDDIIQGIDEGAWNMLKLSDSSSLRILLQIDEEVSKARSLFSISESAESDGRGMLYKEENSKKKLLLIEEKLSPVNIYWMALSAEGYFVEREDSRNFDLSTLAGSDFDLILTDSEETGKQLKEMKMSIPVVKTDDIQRSDSVDYLNYVKPRKFVKAVGELLRKESVV